MPNESPATAQRAGPSHAGGAAIYADQCAGCHTFDGDGIARLLPALKGSPFVQQRQSTSLLRVVLNGMRAVARDHTQTGPGMPAFGWKLSGAQVADVVTFIR